MITATMIPIQNGHAQNEVSTSATSAPHVTISPCAKFDRPVVP